MTLIRVMAAVAILGVLAGPAARADELGQGKGRGKAKAEKAEKKEHKSEGKAQRDERKGDDERDRDHDDQVPMRFRGMDRNGDGVITRAEWRGNDQSFRQHDTNGDGVLSGHEVRPGAADDRTEPADRSRRDELTARFERMDRDHDGRLGRNEWDANGAAFDRMDLNHDGIVTRAEFFDVARLPATESNAEARRGSAAFRAGYDRGLIEGRHAGREDRTANGGKWDLEGQRELEQADSGYHADLGARADYQSGYRAGFRLGYREGFGPRR